MSAPALQLEDLLALAETLRGAGFAVGTQQYIAAHELLIALAARGRLPANPSQWRTLLAPIFCSSKREQEEFAEHFAAWLQRRPALRLSANKADEEAVQLAPMRPLRINAFTALWQWSNRPRVVALLLLALSLAAVGIYRAVITKPKPPDEVAKNEAPPPTTAPALPLPLATIPAVVTPTPEALPTPAPVNRSLWPAVIPLLLYAAWFVWRWWRRKLMLERMQTSGAPRLQQLKLARDCVKLFDSPAFRRAVIELRRHRHVAAHDLDVAATIRATIRQAGLFTPSFGRRRALPEYLLLIDRLSLPDEQAAVGDELARRLAAGEIGVERYYFQGDARTCQQGPFAPALSLNELAARFPEHRLLVFGDGAGFFDAFSGEPQRWLEQFAQWPERALITPVEPGSDHRPDWGYREAWLQEQGFTLLPATANGFELLTAWLGSGLSQEPRDTAAHPYPPLLAERPKRWLERRLPRAEEAATLVAQLRRYLGESGWLWLRACAVYPQVTWELTLYLGARLLPAQGESWASDLLRLVRLPWFRYGTLPDWLRAVLIDEFTPEQNTQVRRVISDLLHHILTNPAQAIALDVATEPPPEQTGWRRWMTSCQQWLERRALFRGLQTQPEESPLRDFVFLSFLAGRQLKPLTVQAPRLWERLLFEGGKVTMGLRPASLFLLTLAISMILLLGGIILHRQQSPANQTNQLAISETPTSIVNTEQQAANKVTEEPPLWEKPRSATRRRLPSPSPNIKLGTYSEPGGTPITGGLKGTVFEKDNRDGISDALVTAINTKTGATRVAKTNTDGVFYFPIMTPAYYEIEVKKDGCTQMPRLTRLTVAVPPTMTTIIKPPLFQLSCKQTASVVYGDAVTMGINGIVVDTELKNNIPSATVIIREVTTGMERSTKTGEDGKFYIGLITPGSYEIEVRKDGCIQVQERSKNTLVFSPPSATKFNNQPLLLSCKQPQ